MTLCHKLCITGKLSKLTYLVYRLIHCMCTSSTEGWSFLQRLRREPHIPWYRSHCHQGYRDRYNNDSYLGSYVCLKTKSQLRLHQAFKPAWKLAQFKLAQCKCVKRLNKSPSKPVCKPCLGSGLKQVSNQYRIILCCYNVHV